MTSRLRWSVAGSLLACVLVGCPPKSSTSSSGGDHMTVDNADFAIIPWEVVAVSEDGGAFEEIDPINHVYDVDLSNVPATAEVELAIGFQAPDSTVHFEVWDNAASWFIQHDPTDYTGDIGGVTTGEVTGSETVGSNQEDRIVVGPRATTLDETKTAFTLKHVPVGTPVAVRSAAGFAGELPTTFTYQSTTLSDNEDISSSFSQVRNLVNAAINSLGLGVLRQFVVSAVFGSLLDDSNDDESPCDGGSYAALRLDDTYEIKVAHASDLPSNALQSLEWLWFSDQTTYASTRIFFNDQSSFSPQAAPTAPPATITTEPAPYQAYRLQGNLSGGYNSFHFSSQSVVSGKRYVLNMWYGYTKNPFNLTTPIDTKFTNYFPPSGSNATTHYSALSYDRFAMPKAGDTRYRSGFTQYFGTPMTPSLTIIPPSTPITIQPGGTAPLTIQIQRTNFFGTVFVSGTSTDPGLAVGDVSFRPSQTTGVVDLVAMTNASVGMHTLSLVGDAIARGVEVPYPFTVIVNVQAPSGRVAAASGRRAP